MYCTHESFENSTYVKVDKNQLNFLLIKIFRKHDLFSPIWQHQELLFLIFNICDSINRHYYVRNEFMVYYDITKVTGK